MAVAKDKLPLIGAGNFPNHIFALEDYRELIGLMMAAERLVADGHGEKAGETESLVVARGFQVAPQRFRAHIDTKHRLGLGPNFAYSPGSVAVPPDAPVGFRLGGNSFNRPILNLSLSNSCS